MKTTISGLTLKTQGTITVSTIKENLNPLSFKWKASIGRGKKLHSIHGKEIPNALFKDHHEWLDSEKNKEV